MFVMVASFILAADLMFSRTEGWLMVAGLIGILGWMVSLGLQRGPADPLALEFEAEIPTDMPMKTAWLWLGVGSIILPLSSSFLVDGAITVARALHVSDAVIGLTIVALGTSLPELAASVTSALRREDDLAIGNIIGSNMFNILGVLGVAATINPVGIEPIMLRQDFPVMFVFTVLLFFMAYGFRGPGRIRRRSGALLLTMYLVYQVIVWMTASPVPG
jgi:cation:H+ antiporter